MNTQTRTKSTREIYIHRKDKELIYNAQAFTKDINISFIFLSLSFAQRYSRSEKLK